MSFLQSTSSNFINLKNGLSGAVSSSETKLKNLLQPTNLDICKQDTAKLSKQIADIIKLLDSISNIINTLLKVLNKLLVFGQFLQKLILGLLILSQILKVLPLPTMFSTAGVIITLSDLLAKITNQLTAGLLTITGLNFVVGYIVAALKPITLQITNIKNLLTLVSLQLKSCTKDPVRSQLALNLDTSLTTLSTSMEDLNTQLGSLLKANNGYKGFVFQIIEEQTTSKVVAVRRYAVALNTQGVLVLQGTPSYATDTEVLIDELKLTIDSKNLNGYVIADPSIEISTDTDSQTAKQFGITDPATISAESADSQKAIDSFINSNAGLKKLKAKFNK